jgi:hypothetical protein
MSQPDRHKEFVDRVRETLDRSADDLDGPTLARLRQARALAIDRGRPRVRPGWWVPTGALAALLVAVLVTTFYVRAPLTAVPVAVVDDAEILASAHGPEFYENLDFYQWLAQEHPHAG